MRAVLFLFVVACGGGSKTSPAPISNQTAPSTSTADPSPMMAASDAPPATCDMNADSAVVAKCAIATMEHYSKQMCTCKDKACADQVNEGLTKWGTEMAKSAGAAKEQKPDPELAKRSAEIMNRYVECMTKLMMDAAPPPDPCGGSDNPCG